MATTTISPGTFSSFANASQTSAPGSCGLCTSAQIYDLWRGSWTQNSSLPALRTIQPYLDPAYNTTSTSTICNTAALTAYDQCLRMSLDDNCDIVCEDLNGRQTSEVPYTITLAGASGNFVQFANSFRIQGGVSTTDSNGASTCLTSFDATLSETSFTYAGPTSVTETGMNLLIMSELTDYYPNEALFEQCTWFQTGPPPVALTAANQIVLPVMTLPGAGTTTTQSSSSSSSTPTTTVRPADSGAGTSPSRTSTPQTTETKITNPPASSDGSTISPPSTGTPDRPEDQPTVTVPENGNEPSMTNSGVSDIAPINTNAPEKQNGEPATSKTQGSGGPPTQSDNDGEQGDNPGTSSAVAVPIPPNDGTPSTATQTQDPNTSTEPQPGDGEPIVPAATSVPVSTAAPIAMVPGVTLQGDNGSPEIVVGGSTTIVAGDAAAVGSGTTFSVLPSASGIVAVAHGTTTTLPLPALVTSADQSFVRPLITSGQAFALPGPTIVGDGEVVAVSGTTFSALPSDLGVFAISRGGSTTVQASRLAGLGISTVADSPGAYVLPDQTLAPGGSAVVISGATYSVLPESSGIQVASNGQTSVVAIAKATSLPGIGEINVVDNVAGGYVVDGSVTLIAGGPAATISDVVYSAISSGLGVLVAESNGSDNFASYIEQGISGSKSGSSSDAPYIIGGIALPPVGSDAVTVSGVVYSALPSGSGILVVADGESTTVGLASPTDGSSHSETYAPATSGSTSNEPNEPEVPYAGAAFSGVRYSTGGSACFFIGLLSILVML